MVKIKGKIKKYGFLIIACLMLVTCVISGTMAKYKSTSPAKGLTVTVAQWGVTVGGDGTDGEKIGNDTISLEGVGWSIGDNGFDHTLINAEEGAGIIAPGTWGYAAIVIENVGDVTATVTIEEDNFLPSESDGGLTSGGLAFGLMDDETSPDSSGSAPSAGDMKQTIAELGLESFSLAKGETETIYVCYVWDLGDPTNNDSDNALGELTEGEDVADTFTFGTLTFTAVQVQNAATD